jgi:hypothetical protein
MGDRPVRARSINEVLSTTGGVPEAAVETLRAAPVAAVQDAIDKFGAAGDALPGPRQMDTSNASVTHEKADSAEAEVLEASRFNAQYEKALSRSTGYLVRRKISGNRNAMVPPKAELHPVLGMWGLQWSGKWMIFRWVSKNPRVRQKRFEQGYQYFEGREWCIRLGLNSENYINEKGRIEYVDLELAWVPEEYVVEKMGVTRNAKDDMVTKARDNLLGQTSREVPRIEILEGTGDEVQRELDERRRYAESR